MEHRKSTESTLQTRESLLERLRQTENADDWKEFYRLYRRLLYHFALGRGLSTQDADEVVQETMVSIARSIQTYEYLPERCSFKGWLRRLAEARIADHFRRKKRRDRLIDTVLDPEELDEVSNMADPGVESPEALWEAKWQNQLLAEAIERVQATCNPSQYRIFDAVVLQGMSGRDVARMFRTNVAVVYVARHRVSRRIAAEVRRIEQRMEGLLRRR